MRIALSNIAWDRPEDADVAALLRRHGLDAVDLVASKYFADAAAASDAEVRAIRAWWADQGFEVTGMQALLFGTTGLALFGDASARDAMLRHLAHICRIGGGLGARALVFGSPRNRDRGTLSDAQVEAIADPFFRALGDIAADHGVVVCLEPNPPHYGGTFMTTSAETRAVVARIDHPAIRMQFDTGALTLSGEAPEAVLAEAGPWIAHVHASEPDLLPLGDGSTDHAAMAAALARRLPDRVVAIEMLATKGEPHLASIERAVVAAKRAYGGDAG
jgi:D-psicose/D-tagatose/L-ribulose 3-epimerase